jgi:basic membrane protein A
VAAVLTRRELLRGLAAFATIGAAEYAPANAAAPLVALVHTQAAGDGGVIDGMIASLKRLRDERGLTTRAIYAADAANYQPILELLGEAQAAVVLTTFDEMAQPMKAVAPVFPNTRFVQLYADPFTPPIRNVRTVAYDTYLASYLSGIFAGVVSTASKIGYIAGMNIPTLDANYNALAAGFRSLRPTGTVGSAFVGSFQDPAKALEIAKQVFSDGVDFIQAEASASDLGIIQAANAKLGRIVIAGARPEFPLGPQSVAAITLCDFGRSLYQETTLALGPAWTNGHYRSGLQDGVVDFVPSPLFEGKGPAAAVAKYRDALPHVNAAKSRIVAGTLKVPFKTNLG